MPGSAAARHSLSRRARRTASRVPKPAAAAARTASDAVRLTSPAARAAAAPPSAAAGGGVRRVGGGGERVGGRAYGGERDVQAGVATELGQQRRAVTGRAVLGGL